MYQQSQRGFAAAAAIGIVAILAILGGGAYVATKYETDIDTDVSTTTDTMRLDGDITVTKEDEAMMKDDATTTMEATSTLNTELDISTGGNAGADVNVNLGY